MPRPVRTATAMLQHYAESHRDRRNIATHLVGVPLMVFGAGVLLARPALQVGSASLTPAWLAFPLAAAWYLTRGHFGLGLAASVAVALLLALGQPLGAAGTAAWLTWGVGALAAGWVDEIDMPEMVLPRALEAAGEFATLQAGAHLASKIRARQSALDAIKAGIDNIHTEFGLS